ncbi:hypothetical protein E1B28_002884 [Marasmius oreades]|uniref:Uncharacterized protein n=1 Tax=Marasmius oreades TaxID=181124 RepID=A0A9P7RQ18_9AGAR|nr:uncharacterized protein E1B28_002884 [Marasmius oreades]KAG7086968.1 hypothetical protein E1B28_002884 [Marasmius oreades]
MPPGLAQRFLDNEDLPVTGLSDDLEILKIHDSGLEMTVCTIPNLWVQPSSGHLCVMPSLQRGRRNPVSSWYMLNTGSGETELKLIPPVSLTS